MYVKWLFDVEKTIVCDRVNAECEKNVRCFFDNF